MAIAGIKDRQFTPWSWAFTAQRAVCISGTLSLPLLMDGELKWIAVRQARCWQFARMGWVRWMNWMGQMDELDGFDGWIGWDLRARGVGRCDWIDVIFR